MIPARGRHAVAATAAPSRRKLTLARTVRREGKLIAVFLLALAMTACGGAHESHPPSTDAAPTGVHPVVVPLLEANGQQPTGATAASPIEVGDLTKPPWSLYLEVSQAAGLDFAALGGRPGELLVTPVAGSAPDAALVVLVVEGRPVGAWLSPGGTSSGVLPIDARP